MHFLLNDSEPTKKFVDMINKSNDKTIKKSTYNFSFNSDINSPEIAKNNLNLHLNKFNLLQKSKKEIYSFKLFEFSGDILIDQQFLNKSHSKFEKWKGNKDLYNNFQNNEFLFNQSQYELDRINNCIHILEQKLLQKYSQKSKNYYIAARLSFTTDERIKLSRKWFKYFSMDTSFGDLRMNYATKGKNLGHIFKDNDLEHLKNGGKVTPQKYFNTGINAFFGGYSLNKLNQNNTLANQLETTLKLKKWIVENELTKKYKISYKKSHFPGYIILGKFLPKFELNMNSTILDVINYYSGYDKFCSYRLEE